MLNLEGKTVLIVGAGRGIRRRTAELFSEADAKVVISSRNEPEWRNSNTSSTRTAIKTFWQ